MYTLIFLKKIKALKNLLLSPFLKILNIIFKDIYEVSLYFFYIKFIIFYIQIATIYYFYIYL